MIDALARHPVFVDHMAPVWRALPATLRGELVVTPEVSRHCRLRGLDCIVLPKGDVAPHLARRAGLVYVAYFGDVPFVRKARREAVVGEHGACQTYVDAARGWDGKLPNRARVRAFLVPHERYAAVRRRYHPEIPVHVIGTPKMDVLPGRAPIRSAVPTVAISFHWDSQACAETRGSFKYWREVLPRVAEQFHLLGHAHPQLWAEAADWYDRVGIEPVADFEQVLRRADVYAVDNSSTLFEFAATGRPVVVLNPPWFRRNVHHGMRFWEWADIGVQCDRPTDLLAAIADALADTPERAERRREISAVLYPYRGQATRRAVDALIELAALPPCRLRGSRKASGRFTCESIHYHMVDGVTEDICAKCPFVDQLGAALDRVSVPSRPKPGRRRRRSGTVPCVHLGQATGETVECDACQGKVALKLFGCDVHGNCTVRTKVGETACCPCSDYRAAAASGGSAL